VGWKECGRTNDHEDQVSKTCLQKHFGGDILDEEVHSLDRKVDTSIERQELQNLGIEVDLCRKVLDFDVDFANGN
jgi:hypothetical protein